MSSWTDSIWNAVDIVSSPLSSIDKYVVKGGVTKAATLALSPATNLGKMVGDQSPILRAKAQVVTKAVQGAGITPEGLLISGLDLVAPIEAPVVAASKAIKLVKVAQEAKKVSLFTDMVKMIAKPGVATRVVDIGTDAFKAASRVVPEVVAAGSKSKVTLTSGGRILDAAQQAAAWNRVVDAAKVANTAADIKAIKQIQAYQEAASHIRQVQTTAATAGRMVSFTEAAKAATQIKDASNIGRVMSVLPDVKTIAQVASPPVPISTFSKMLNVGTDLVSTTTKSVFSAKPYIIGGAVGAGILGTAAAGIILLGDKDITTSPPGGNQAGAIVPPPTGQQQQTADAGPDWNKLMKDLMAGNTGGGGNEIDWAKLLNPGAYDNPIGSQPDTSVLPDDPGYLGSTGNPILDAPVDVINNGLDQLGLDSDFAEGIREATGMGPVVGPVVVGGIAVLSGVIAWKSGLLGALGDFTISDIGIMPGSGSKGEMLW